MKLLVMILVAVGLLYLGNDMLQRFMQPVGNVRCVEVVDAQQFIGNNLKLYGQSSEEIVPLSECQLRDTERDGGNGGQQGRIRWAKCQVDQECSQAGND